MRGGGGGIRTNLTVVFLSGVIFFVVTSGSKEKYRVRIMRTHSVRTCLLCLRMCVFFLLQLTLKRVQQKKFLLKNSRILRQSIPKKPTLSCSDVGGGKCQFLGKGSGKGEGEVLSDGWGVSIMRKNILQTKKTGFVN